MRRGERVFFFTDFGAVIIRGRKLLLVGSDLPRSHVVPCYGPGSDMATFIERAGLTCSTGTFPDGLRVVYIYDRHDGAFGYAWNIDWPDGSEWGYAPVAGSWSDDEGVPA